MTISQCSDDLQMQLCVASTIWWSIADYNDPTDPDMIELKRLSRLYVPPTYADFDPPAVIKALRKCGFPYQAAKRRAQWRDGNVGVINADQHMVGRPLPSQAYSRDGYREMHQACLRFWANPRLDTGTPREESS